MRSLDLNEVARILCLGAHADDIEIGCGGTLLDILRERPELTVHWVVLSADDARREEARSSAARFLDGIALRKVIVESFRDGYFPYQGEEIKNYFEQLKIETMPDIIFTHHGLDLHQDHRLVSELTWNTFRNHLILEYEVPKYDGGMGSPNVFVPLAADIVNKKLTILDECFPSQRRRPWFDRDTFRSLMRLRGMECNAHSRYAEAFYAKKLCLSAKSIAE